MTDLDLLRHYRQSGAEASFAELVNRHIHWVHSAARRQVSDAHLAEDVTQAVFIVLAQKACKLPTDVILPAWLFRVTRYAAAKALRADTRRKHHEHKAAAMKREPSTTTLESEWERMAPVLDELVARLKHEDQQAVLLRFYQHKSFAQIAQDLGISENAAQKRAERALDHLRELFSRRGFIVASSASLATLLTNQVTVPAHASLVAATTATCLSVAQGGAAASVPFALAQGVIAVMTSLKTSVVVAAIVLGVILAVGTGTAIVAFHSSGGPPAPAPKPVVKKTAGIVYELNLDRQLGPEWSRRRSSVTADRKHKFLGPFSEGPVTLTVDGLPAHEFLRVTFELITYNPWNGDSQNFGRDLWDMRVVGGQPLIHTTFSNCGFFTNNNEQSFPDQYPWYPTHPAWTGAATHESMGHNAGWRDEKGGFHITDSTYAFDLTFPHAADTLRLQFRSHIKRNQDKPYGFLSFRVQTVDHAAPAHEQALARWWQDLSDEDPVKAYQAVWSLVATGDAATEYIRGKLPASADFGVPMSVDLSQIWTHGSFSCNTPELRQRARAIHVLEAIGSPASTSMLRDIGYAGTPQDGPPTRWDQQ